ncbi:MAG: metallophosphoesterase family protein [Oscillospiraceae bacterium]|jgi:predicted phosphodiesterase
MKIGVICDIHSNLPALEAAVGELRRRGCSSYIICGDIVGFGPRPEECVNLVRSLPLTACVRGNHEDLVLAGGPEKIGIPSRVPAEHFLWQLERLSGGSRSWLASLPAQSGFEFAGLPAVVTHWPCPEGKRADVKAPMTPEYMSTFLEGPGILLFGHHHDPCSYESGDVHIIDFGTLGCVPEGANALCGIISDEEGFYARTVEVEFSQKRNTADMKRLGVPSADWIIAHYFNRTV